MARTLSVDLAYTSYEKFGACLIEGVGRPPWRVRLVKPAEMGLAGEPAPAACAEALARFAAAQEVDILLLDGPQGWKDPASGDPTCRACERELACPAKTGTEGNVRPRNYLPFVEFSIALFSTLVRRWGMALLSLESGRRRPGVLLAEVFPRAAWKGLGLPAIPAKSRCPPETLDRFADRLAAHLGIDRLPPLSHDELQAVAAGAAGPALAAGRPSGAGGTRRGLRLAGRDPIPAGRRYFLEGWIAVPAPW